MTPQLDSRRDRALDLLIAGATKKAVAAEVGVSRNTITAWLREPAFRVELSRRIDERLAEVKLRRLVQTTRYVDRLFAIADAAMTAAEHDPLDRGARCAAREWLRMYRRVRHEERLDRG